MQEALKALNQYWGYQSFREGQDKAVQSILQGSDTLVLFPTGGGKSLCYQVPALVFPGITLVISPLIALMDDQVKQLKDRGISATFINSTMSRRKVEQVLINARNGMYRLLYCSPERLATSLWKLYAPELDLSLVAVDESHCISQWGHDFRPSYREIHKNIVASHPEVRWMALTATATPEVKKDIIERLQFQDPAIIELPFDRPNLEWHVQKEADISKALLEFVKGRRDSGLIYAQTRKRCEELSSRLNEIGIQTEPYHGGLKSEERAEIQDRWISGDLPLVVCTNAFGMGVDKPDCRYVLHDGPSASLEAYIQEAGRAGRDRKHAEVVLFWNEHTFYKQESIIKRGDVESEWVERAYSAICDELGLSVGENSPEERLIAFEHILRRSHLNRNQLEKALEVLENEGVVDIGFQRAKSFTVSFLVDRGVLRDLIDAETNTRKSAFMESVQRVFQRPNSQTTMLSVEEATEYSGFTFNQLFKGMKVLEADKVLTCEVNEAMLMTTVPQSRVPKLNMDVDVYKKGIAAKLGKLNAVRSYAQSMECRSWFLMDYFGQTAEKTCDHCDRCLSEQNLKAGNGEAQIMALIKNRPHTFAELKKVGLLPEEELKLLLSNLIQAGVVSKSGFPARYSA